LGSCIQIALFVAPVLVLASYFIAPHPLDLAFGRAEIGSLFIAVLIGAMVCSGGQSNWYKGIQLITVYAIIALMFYFIPDLSRCSPGATPHSFDFGAIRSLNHYQGSPLIRV